MLWHRCEGCKDQAWAGAPPSLLLLQLHFTPSGNANCRFCFALEDNTGRPESTQCHGFWCKALLRAKPAQAVWLGQTGTLSRQRPSGHHTLLSFTQADSAHIQISKKEIHGIAAWF